MAKEKSREILADRAWCGRLYGRAAGDFLVCGGQPASLDHEVLLELISIQPVAARNVIPCSTANNVFAVPSPFCSGL